MLNLSSSVENRTSESIYKKKSFRPGHDVLDSSVALEHLVETPSACQGMLVTLAQSERC